jgi:hypothetical protein
MQRHPGRSLAAWPAVLRRGIEATHDDDLIAEVGTVGRGGFQAAFGYQLVAQAGFARSLPESLPQALQGGAASRVPPREGILNRAALAHEVGQ